MTANENAALREQGGAENGCVGNAKTTGTILPQPKCESHPPVALASVDRWITWRLVPQDDGSTKKVPLASNGRAADCTDPKNWLSYVEAKARAPKDGGVGFVFTDDDMIGGIDLDGCRDPATGNLTDWAQEWVNAFNSYTEVSPSGTGVKIFADGAMPKLPANVITMPGEPIRGKCPQVEVYVSGRYFAFTGHKLPEAPAEVLSSGAWLKLHGHLKEAAAAGRGGGVEGKPMAGRNDALYRHGCGLRAKGWSAAAIRAAIEAENSDPESGLHPNFADGPLDRRDLETVIRSVMKKPSGVAVAARGLTLTDTGNGERLVARHGADLLYCYAWKSWLVYDGKRYRPDNRGEADRRAKDTALAIYDEAKAAAAQGDEKHAALTKHAVASQQRQRLEAMLWAARSELPVTVDELDTDGDLLNLENGTLDLRDLTLREHQREDRLTKLAPVHLDGEARCPTWEAFLDRIFDGDGELVRFMQRTVGYTLTGSVQEHVFFLLHGTGANGKTTLVKTLAALLGDYARSVRVEALLASDRSRAGAPNEDVANLFGVRLASTGEPDEQFRLNEALIKALTGGDTISARRLHEQLFEFQPTHKLWLAANHKPEIRGVDEGIWRRVMFIPFEVTIPEDERDPHLPDKLLAELPGILNWAVEGLRAYQGEGLNPPEKVLAAKDKYKAEQDILADFLAAECEIGGGHYAITDELTQAYESFTGAEAVKAQTFARLLKARGFERGQKKMDGRNKRVWYGLRLVNPGPRYDERNPPPPDEGDLIPF